MCIYDYMSIFYIVIWLNTCRLNLVLYFMDSEHRMSCPGNQEKEINCAQRKVRSWPGVSWEKSHMSLEVLEGKSKLMKKIR